MIKAKVKNDGLHMHIFLNGCLILLISKLSVQLINDGNVTRLKCRRNLTDEDVNSYTIYGKIDEKKQAENAMNRFKNDAKDEDATVKLEQDRVFHTCHILPTTVQK